jgi:hypothetical protein
MRARNIIKSLPGGSPAALISFDLDPTVVVSETRDLARVESELRVLEPGYEATDLGAALRAGAEAGNRLNARSVRVVIVSDFQRSAVQQVLAPVAVRAGVAIEPLQVGTVPPLNLDIASAQVVPGEDLDRRTILLELRRYGTDSAQGEIELFHEEESLGVQPLNWVGDQTFVEFTVEKPFSSDAILEAEIRAEDSPLEDNRYSILLEVPHSIPVLILEDLGRMQFASKAGGLKVAGTNRFLRAAAVAHGARADVTWMDGTDFSMEQLVPYPVILAVDVDAYGADAISTLESYVESGGALVIFPGAGDVSAFERLSGSVADGWQRVDKNASQYRLVSTLRHDGPLDLLGSTGESVLGHPKVYSYLAVVPDPQRGTATIAQFDDGAPFLLERTMADGLLYAFTVPMNTASTDFVLRASFAPFLYELMAYAAHETEAPRRYATGDRAPSTLTRGIHTIHTPAGEEREVRQGLSFDAPGVYRFESDSTTALVTVNIDPLESDMTRLNSAEIESISALHADSGTGAGAGQLTGIDVILPPDEDGKFWRYLLTTALVVLAFESLLASRTVR